MGSGWVVELTLRLKLSPPRAIKYNFYPLGGDLERIYQMFINFALICGMILGSNLARSND